MIVNIANTIQLFFEGCYKLVYALKQRLVEGVVDPRAAPLRRD